METTAIDSHDKDGNPMQTIDELPLDWFFRPGIKFDFRNMQDGQLKADLLLLANANEEGVDCGGDDCPPCSK